MSGKRSIVRELGEEVLLLPRVLNDALAANDRTKYYFTLLQTAAAQADLPRSDAPRLDRERRAAGVEDPGFDDVVASARRLPDGALSIDQAARIHECLVKDVGRMIEPLRLAGNDAAEFEQRLRALRQRTPDLAGGIVPDGLIADLTDVRRESLHLLVMDLHRALNALQGEIAEATLSGARVYGLEESDHAAVNAFMDGLHRTAPLKFDHPGLGTTATRIGERLLLQNDIGTTDAHVLVVHVDPGQVTITYTDIHIERARFFESLLESRGVQWEDTRARRATGLETDQYYLCTGVYRSDDPAARDAFLEYLGSRIVFLIDWNRARKRLRPFLPKRRAIELLRWAAEKEYGHRAWLELGGERLLLEALDYAAATRSRYGERLDKVLGLEPTTEYLQYVLKTTSEGLQRGRSHRFVRDAVRTELLRYFDGIGRTLLELCEAHARYLLEIATGTHEAILQLTHANGSEFARRMASRAAQWEQKADEIVGQIRSSIRRSTGTKVYEPIIHQADDAADGIEECAHLLTLCPPTIPSSIAELARWVVVAAQEWIKALESAVHVHRGGAGEDLQDFLESVDRIVEFEHRADDVERQATADLLREAPDFRQFHVQTKLAHELEDATDCLSHAALRLRDYLLEEAMAR
ncbi:MAG: DUF47 domain-containing protein [Planctomycetota bacterium]